MGVVNVTPDSFSDGGRYATTEAAIAHGAELRAEGADLLDIGGESTRPGATRPLVAEELDRVVPVIRALAADGVAVSVDTMRHEVAAAALEAGAVVVNDVSGGLADPRILDVVAERGAAYVVMHWRAHSAVMREHATYDDVRRRRPHRARPASRGGAGGRDRAGPARRRPRSRVRQDRRPQLGAAPAAARARVARGARSWSGRAASRSSAPCWPGRTAARARCDDREDANVALTTIAAIQGVWGVRVHEVRASLDAIRVVSRWLGD